MRSRFAHERILDVSRSASGPRDHDSSSTAVGVRLGWRWNAVEAVGLYVPGGTASYPSSVLMNADARPRWRACRASPWSMTVPMPRGGKANPLVLAAAADRAGVEEIYRDRRCPGDRGIGVRDGDDPGGRQDRWPGKRLRGRCQAPRLRACRHRHHRRSVRGADPGRCAGAGSRVGRGGPPGAGRTRRGRAVDPDHRRRGALATKVAEPPSSGSLSLAAAGRDRSGRAGSDHGAIIVVEQPGGEALPIDRQDRARASRDRWPRMPTRWPNAVSATPAPSSSGRHTPEAHRRLRRRVRTTCCRRRARRASPPASACWTS